MVKQYEDSAQLAGDATLLVVGEMTGSSEVEIGNLIFTQYMMKVERTLAGDARGELAVYVVGAPGWEVSLEVPDYFDEGVRYALFLRPTELPAGTVGDDGYYIVGMGAWGATGDGAFRIWVDSTEEVDLAEIPMRFAESEITEVLSADKVGSAR